MTYSAVVTINGTSYNYPAGPAYPGFQVEFRPDEIVFHLGVAFDKSFPWANLGPYTVGISKDGTLLATVSIPTQYWNTSWLYEINPDTVVNTPAQIIANGWVLPFGKDAALPLPPKPANVFKGPLDSGGIALNESQTGERPDIGWLNEWSGYFMVAGDPGPMIAAAQGIRATPMFIRDETTGRPVDKIAVPNMNDYPTSAEGGTWLGPFPASPNTAQNWDVGHNPESGYLAFLATGKLRHLETVCYNANKSLLFDISRIKLAGNVAILPEGQTRGFAWGLRNLAQAWKGTLIAEAMGPLPSYLFPSSHWKQHLDNELAWLTKAYKNYKTDVFRFFPQQDFLAPWQQEMATFTLLHLAAWLPAEWGDLLIWSLGNLMPRVSPSVAYGWSPMFPNAYRYRTGPAFTGTSAGGPMTLQPAQFFPTWAAMRDDFYAALAGTGGDVADLEGYNGITTAMIAKIEADPTYGGSYMAPDFYCLYVRTCLAWAVVLDRAKIVNISGTWPELEQAYALQDKLVRQWLALPTTGFHTFPARQSAQVAPATIVPQQPSGVIVMSATTFSIPIGATKQLNLDDGSGNPAVVAGTPQYASSDPTVMSLAPNATGVLVTALKAGTSKITVSAIGAGNTALTAESDGTVTVPLSVALTLVPVG